MKKPLLCAGAAAAGYLATKGRSARGRRAERKDEVWADGKLLYAGDDWREAKATYLLYTQTAPGRAWVTGWARIPRKGSHVIWRQKAPHSPGGVEGPWVFVGIASRTQEEGSKYRARLAKAYAKKGSRAARSAQGRRARFSDKQRQRWMKKFNDLMGDPQPKPDDYWDTAYHLMYRGLSPEEAAEKRKAKGRSARGRRAKTKSHLFRDTAAGKLPGDLLQTGNVSESTLRRWERRGWISDRGWVRGSRTQTRFRYTILTQAGYRAS